MTTATTNPFADIAAKLEAGWECRPSLLEYVSPSTPSSVSELRMKWAECFFSTYSQWVRECSQYSLSEEECDAIVRERVMDHVNDCASPCLDSFHLWAYLRLTNNPASDMFEFPDERQYVGGPYDAMAQDKPEETA